MSEANIRQWKILESLPRQPRKLFVKEIQDILEASGIFVSIRTIQRDLVSLSSIFPLVNDDDLNESSRGPYGWSWHKDANGVNPAMDPVEALTLSLAKEYLAPIMPTKTFNRIGIFFDRANNVLNQMEKSRIKRWKERVKVVSQWQRLIPPKIDPEVESEIYNGVFYGKQLEALYHKKSSDEAEIRTVNPLGIVLHGVIHRLICTMDEDPNPRHLPIHRFKFARVKDTSSIEPKDFKMDNFISEENIGFLVSKRKIEIEVKFTASAGFHLTETPLTEDQKLRKIIDNGRIKGYVLKALVYDSSQIRWWLLGFGSQVEVIKPDSLRQEFKSSAREQAKLYGV